MAKKKESINPETAAGGMGQEATGQPAVTKRGRAKKADAPLAEMGVPVTSEPQADAGATTEPIAPKPTGRGRKKTDVPAMPEPVAAKPKATGRGRKVQAPIGEEGLPIPAAPSDAGIVAKPKRGKTIKQEMPQAPAINMPQPVQEQLPEQAVYYNISRFTEFDIYLFREGRHFTLYDKLGSHPMEHAGVKGTYFAVWAPNAEQVSVMGDFNSWDRESHQLQARGDHSGIWEGFIPNVTTGMMYKYHIRSRYNFYHVEKSDPFAFAREAPPQTASVVCDLHHTWKDEAWLQQRQQQADQPKPYAVYEMHVGSWRRKAEDNNRPLTYRELAEELPAYLKEMGFTHVEFLPVMFHPFNGSWGYQITGYFAAASQFGSPQDLMHLIDVLHQEGIGVILDWVPSHFPSDQHGLVYFDGTHLYEHADPRKGYHPDWNSYIFNYGRNEVKSFLISNALFWLDKYHADGLRVDAVASMLYLDYSRKHNEWIPNEHGGRENLEAIAFIKDFNEAVHSRFPDVKTIAEESTAWPAVTGATDQGGLGFNMKWMMGWMHDSLRYFSTDPIYRRHHQGDITFSIIYAFSERFMLPLSHDEVVHGKGSLLGKMPGDEWQRFANLRALYAYMYAHPGAKLLFMGSEFGQSSEWNHDSSLDWHLLQYGFHSGVQQLVRELNHVYRQEPSLYDYSFDSRGFEWVDFGDAHNSVISFLRKGERPEDHLLVVCNLTPVVHDHYRLGVPEEGYWEQILNTDDERFGGSNVQNLEPLHSIAESYHGRDYSLELRLPPLAVVYFKYKPGQGSEV